MNQFMIVPVSVMMMMMMMMMLYRLVPDLISAPIMAKEAKIESVRTR
jgi:hypothetical protein